MAPNSFGYSAPASAAPASGASQGAHSWPGAPAPLKNATPVERAGLTEVLEIGIEMRWIRVSVSPIEMPANPLGARSSVDPQNHQQEDKGEQHLGDSTAVREYPCGELAP